MSYVWTVIATLFVVGFLGLLGPDNENPSGAWVAFGGLGCFIVGLMYLGAWLL